MKTAVFVFFFLCISASAFGQAAAVMSAYPQPLHMIEHPEHASLHAMAQESSLLGGSAYSYAKGEVPLAELGSPIYYVPLGDLAREARKEHAHDLKATKIFEN